MSICFPETTPSALYVGQRVFVPEDVLEEFVVDFLASYPNSSTVYDTVRLCSALIGDEYPEEQRGTWFHFNPYSQTFFMADHKEGWFYTIPLEHVWTHCPTQQSFTPLDLDSIYS